MPYPELFWSRYIGLGSQNQTPKGSEVLIYGVSFHQHSLSQSQNSDVLSYSERRIGKNFQGFVPGPHWEGLTTPLPDSPAAQRFFSSLRSSKNRHPQKIAGYGTDMESFSRRTSISNSLMGTRSCTANQRTCFYVVETLALDVLTLPVPILGKK